MNKYYTLATNSSTAVATSAIGETRIRIVSSLQTHFVELNGTATSTSLVIPEGAELEFEIPPGSTISALAHSGQGHISVIYF
jgi:hypothetical protein